MIHTAQHLCKGRPTPESSGPWLSRKQRSVALQIECLGTLHAECLLKVLLLATGYSAPESCDRREMQTLCIQTLHRYVSSHGFQVLDFVARRLEVLLVDEGAQPEVVRAVLAQRGGNPALAAASVRELQVEKNCQNGGLGQSDFVSFCPRRRRPARNAGPSQRLPCPRARLHARELQACADWLSHTWESLRAASSSLV